MRRLTLRLSMAAAAVALLTCGVAAQLNILDVKPGETVNDRAGGLIGTVVSVTDGIAVLDTGGRKVTVGLGSFNRPAGKTLVLPMNREMIEAAADKAQAAGDEAMLALLKPGAPVFDSTGDPLGSVVGIVGREVTVEVGQIQARLPVSAFSKGAKGPAIHTTRAAFITKLEAQQADKPR